MNPGDIQSGAIEDPLAKLSDAVANCFKCPLAQTRTHTVLGEGNENASIMVVGEAPGKDEDLQGLPFVGRSGRLLRGLLSDELGSLAQSLYIANLIKCRPPNNRDPEIAEINACSSYLKQQLSLIGPRVILSVGAFSSRHLLETSLGIGQIRGRAYELEGRILIPTYHPAAALRGGGSIVAKMRSDIALVVLALRGEVEICPRP